MAVGIWFQIWGAAEEKARRLSSMHCGVWYRWQWQNEDCTLRIASADHRRTWPRRRFRLYVLTLRQHISKTAAAASTTSVVRGSYVDVMEPSYTNVNNDISIWLSCVLDHGSPAAARRCYRRLTTATHYWQLYRELFYISDDGRDIYSYSLLYRFSARNTIL